MSKSKMVLSGGNSMLVLKLLEEEEMYGYQIIEELERRSENVFKLKAGTLYPILHGLEKKELVTSYEKEAENGKVRKYYTITSEGKKILSQQVEEWTDYMNAMEKVIGGANYAV
ncbi:PadR family transcriptional regulator [Anaerosphaera multitolerans]|uniref:PadR family transcriptional regulator n=1 Tax=Anaerosphaera multitolerans TaxID=2487351 RepID=A0A437S710_9FIRM|nr:PadR family transcriptional regulator [Anaerosphaera multitolerans]RVU54815.1 PadR family transcriptional regulator [Anaerosphaera multitolerans]